MKRHLTFYNIVCGVLTPLWDSWSAVARHRFGILFPMTENWNVDLSFCPPQLFSRHFSVPHFSDAYLSTTHFSGAAHSFGAASFTN